MSNILHVNASATINGSVSRGVTAQVIADLTTSSVKVRDLAAEPLPQIDEAWVNARLVPEQDITTADQDRLAQSDALIAELQDADTIVIGLPIYNFGVPASLKAWMDLVARPGVTFRYTENGPIGLLEGKTAKVVYASGGVPMGSDMDFATPHLRLFLNFIGITDVEIIDASTFADATAA